MDSFDAQAGMRFPTTTWREGYAVDEVDAFIVRAEKALSARDGSVTSSDASTVRFTPVRLRTGYDMAAVDEHLDRLAASLTAVETSAAQAPTTPAGGGHCAGCRCVELGLV